MLADRCVYHIIWSGIFRQAQWVYRIGCSPLSWWCGSSVMSRTAGCLGLCTGSHHHTASFAVRHHCAYLLLPMNSGWGRTASGLLPFVSLKRAYCFWFVFRTSSTRSNKAPSVRLSWRGLGLSSRPPLLHLFRFTKRRPKFCNGPNLPHSSSSSCSCRTHSSSCNNSACACHNSFSRPARPHLSRACPLHLLVFSACLSDFSPHFIIPLDVVFCQ